MPAGDGKTVSMSVREVILQAIRQGNWRSTACLLAGIHEDTLRAWMRKAAKGMEPYHTFVKDMVEAEAWNEAPAVKCVSDAIKGGDARMALEWLRVRHISRGWQGAGVSPEGAADGVAMAPASVTINNYNLNALSRDELLALRAMQAKLVGSSRDEEAAA